MQWQDLTCTVNMDTTVLWLKCTSSVDLSAQTFLISYRGGLYEYTQKHNHRKQCITLKCWLLFLCTRDRKQDVFWLTWQSCCSSAEPLPGQLLSCDVIYKQSFEQSCGAVGLHCATAHTQCSTQTTHPHDFFLLFFLYNIIRNGAI